MPLPQARRAHQHARSLDAAAHDDRLGPLTGVVADAAARVPREFLNLEFDPAELFRGDVLIVRADASGLAPRVHGDLLETVVEHAWRRAELSCLNTQRRLSWA